MADINNNNNDGEYEVYCQMCRRSKSQVKDMFRLFDGMYICSDCMHKTMDTMGQFGFSPINPFNMGTNPGTSNSSINSGTPLGSIFGDLNKNSKDELKKIRIRQMLLQRTDREMMRKRRKVMHLRTIRAARSRVFRG